MEQPDHDVVDLQRRGFLSELWRVDAQHPQVGGVPLEGIKYVLGVHDRATGWLSVWMGNSAAC